MTAIIGLLLSSSQGLYLLFELSDLVVVILGLSVKIHYYFICAHRSIPSKQVQTEYFPLFCNSFF